MKKKEVAMDQSNRSVSRAIELSKRLTTAVSEGAPIEVVKNITIALHEANDAARKLQAPSEPENRHNS